MQGILPSKVNNIMLGHNNNPEETVQPLPRVISLNVGGHHFVTTLSTLTKENSMLATMFSGRHNLETDSKGRYFIDRDGTRFLYILNYLRDEMHLPPADVALQVYKEAQFYQIQSLIDILERYSNVFALKLENAKKSKLGIELEKSQAALITRAQNKSLLSLSSTSKVSLLSQEDHKKIMECGDCVGPHAHNLVVAKPFKQGFVHHQESVDNVQRRLKSTELVICNLTNQQMKLFIDITESDLRENGYHCEFREETIRCKNIKLHYGIGKEECSFHVTENVVEFQW